MTGKRLLSSRQGLTLIEIIVSLAIIAIIFIAFSAVFLSGFKGIINAGHRSRADYTTQSVIEDKLVTPVNGTNGNVQTNVTTPVSISMTFGSVNIAVQGKMVNSLYDDGKRQVTITGFVPQ